MKNRFIPFIIRIFSLTRPALFSLLPMLIIIVGCSQKEPAVPPGQPVYGGTLRLKIVDPVENLDPVKILFYTDWTVSGLIYEGLVKYGEDFHKLEPLLAESWEKRDGGRRWIFTLRRGIHFQDDACFPDGKGRELTAEDVRYTFRRIADPAVASPNWYMFSGKIEGIDDFHSGRTTDISGIRVLDSLHVEFRLTRPYVTFLKLLATPTASIVPREAVEYYREDFRLHPVGTGPFVLARWKPLEKLVLVRNSHYWRQTANGYALPFLNTVQFLIKSNYSFNISDFLKGEFDVLSVSDSEYVRLSKMTDFSKKYLTRKYFGKLSVRFLGFSLNADSPLARDVNLRRALALGFHRKELNQSLSGVYFRFANSLVPPILLNNAVFPGLEYNSERARRLIRQSKFADFNRPITVCSNLRSPALVLFKKNVQELGLPVELDIRDVRYYRHIIEDRPDIFRVSFIPSYPDPEDYYMLFYSRSGAGINLTGYHNPEFDRILEQAFFEQDSRERDRLFRRLEEILQQDVPAIYLFHRKPGTVITPRSVHGIKSGFLIMDYSEVWMERE